MIDIGTLVLYARILVPGRSGRKSKWHGSTLDMLVPLLPYVNSNAIQNKITVRIK